VSCENVLLPRGINSISASLIPQSDSDVLVFMVVSKLLVDISSTNCDLLYHISCMYVHYSKISVMLTGTVIKQHSLIC